MPKRRQASAPERAAPRASLQAILTGFYNKCSAANSLYVAAVRHSSQGRQPQEDGASRKSVLCYQATAFPLRVQCQRSQFKILAIAWNAHAECMGSTNVAAAVDRALVSQSFRTARARKGTTNPKEHKTK